jgi:hypothetical protein
MLNLKAQEILFKIWNDASANSLIVGRRQTKFNHNIYQSESDGKRMHVKGNTAVVDIEALKSMNIAELKLSLIIMGNLMMNNAFWYCENEVYGSRTVRTISSLKKKGILYPTDTKHLYIVNPLKIRVGGFDTVIAATCELVNKDKPLTQKSVKRLIAPDKAFKPFAPFITTS